MVFLEDEMQLQSSDADNIIVSYSDFEYVMETAEFLLLTYQGRATVLQKRDLIADNTADFCAFISSRVKLIREPVA